MTSIVTALGLLPLAVGMNEPGREIEGPMALVIVGGLATSMALNLLVLPTLALQFGKFGAKRRRCAGGRRRHRTSPRLDRLRALLSGYAHGLRLLKQPLAHEFDVQPQMIELIGEVERIADAPHACVDTLDLRLKGG